MVLLVECKVSELLLQALLYPSNVLDTDLRVLQHISLVMFDVCPFIADGRDFHQVLGLPELMIDICGVFLLVFLSEDLEFRVIHVFLFLSV